MLNAPTTGEQNGWNWREGNESDAFNYSCGLCGGAFSHRVRLIRAVDPQQHERNVHTTCWDAFHRRFVLGYMTIELSPDAVAVLAGMTASDDEVNAQGIDTTVEVWDEIRAAFPLAVFHEWAERNKTGMGYNPNAGM